MTQQHILAMRCASHRGYSRSHSALPPVPEEPFTSWVPEKVLTMTFHQYLHSRPFVVVKEMLKM